MKVYKTIIPPSTFNSVLAVLYWHLLWVIYSQTYTQTYTPPLGFRGIKIFGKYFTSYR